MRTVTGRALALLALGVAVSACGAPLLQPACVDVVGQALPTPGPTSPTLSTAWHDEALGERPRWVQARRTQTTLGPHCSGGTSQFLAALDDIRGYWAQEDTFEGATARDRSTEGVVCVFYPSPDVVPTNVMREPKRLASGALEGELWEDHKRQIDGAAFLLEAGVVVVARGRAVARVRAMVEKSASPPPPLPIADAVEQWTYSESSGPELHWLLFNGVSLERRTFANETEAKRDLQDRLARGSGKRRAWRSGNDVYRFSPR